MFLSRVLGSLICCLFAFSSVQFIHASDDSSHEAKHCKKKKYKKGEYDYIIVGNGTAGAVLARKLSDNHKNKVLVVEAGPNLSDDPVVLTPNVFSVINEISFSPKFSITYPYTLDLGLLQNVVYSEGRMWGGSSAHNYLQAVRGTPNFWDSFAAESGDARWTYNNLLPVMKAVETYTPDGTVANPAQRGSNGPIFITQNVPVDQDSYPQAISVATHAPLVADYNDPTTGNTSVSTYQQFVTPGADSHRSFSSNAYLPASVVTPKGKGVGKRQLRIISNSTVSRVLFNGKIAKGIEFIKGGKQEKVKYAYAKKKIILCSGSVQTPALLLRSGIGNANHLTSLGIPVVLNNPNVGENLVNHYGAIAVLSGGTPTNSQAMINGWPFYPDDDVRRIQYLNNGGLPVNFGYGFIMNPKSRGSIKIVNKDPFTDPLVDLALYSDGDVSTFGTDAYTIVSFLKILQNIAAAAGEVVFSPSPDFYASDELLLQYAASNPNLIQTQR